MNQQHQNNQISSILLFAGGYLMVYGMFAPISAGLGIIAFAAGVYLSYGKGAALQGVNFTDAWNAFAAKLKALLAGGKPGPTPVQKKEQLKKEQLKKKLPDPDKVNTLIWEDCPASANRLGIDARAVKWSQADIDKLYNGLMESGKKSAGYALAFRFSRIMDSADFPQISVQKLMSALQHSGSYAFVRPSLFSIKTMKNVFSRSGLLIRPSARSQIHFALICHQEGTKASVTIYTILMPCADHEQEYAKKLLQGVSEKCLAVEKQIIEVVSRELRAMSSRG